MGPDQELFQLRECSVQRKHICLLLNSDWVRTLSISMPGTLNSSRPSVPDLREEALEIPPRISEKVELR